MKRLALALACSIVVACAAHKASQMAGAPPAAQATTEGPRAQIEQLSQELEKKRNDMGLPAPAGETPPTAPRVESMAAPPPFPPRSAQGTTCHPAANDTCKQSCTLSDDICGNAEHICDLAQQLPGDDWADRKCRDAKATCTAAHAKCCACM